MSLFVVHQRVGDIKRFLTLRFFSFLTKIYTVYSSMMFFSSQPYQGLGIVVVVVEGLEVGVDVCVCVCVCGGGGGGGGGEREERERENLNVLPHLPQVFGQTSQSKLCRPRPR